MTELGNDMAGMARIHSPFLPGQSLGDNEQNKQFKTNKYSRSKRDMVAVETVTTRRCGL